VHLSRRPSAATRRGWRRPRHSAAGLTAAIAALVVPLVFAGPARAANVTFTDIGQVASSLEVNNGWQISRDCGFTAQPGANYIGVLWVFCDTTVSPTGWYHFGATAGTGQPAAAGSQSLVGDLTDSAGNPQAFLTAKSGYSCSGGFVTAWTSGAVSVPTSPANSKLVIPYVVYCVTESADTPLAFRTVDYDTASKSFSNDTPYGATAGIFHGSPIAWTDVLGSPVVANGALYLYARTCTIGGGGCAAGTGQVKVAKVTLGPNPMSAYSKGNASSGHRWLDPANYTFATVSASGGSWSPSALDVHRYPSLSGSPFVGIEQNDVTGHATFWSASSPVGPFTKRSTATVPCTYPTGSKDLCRAYIGHPESSSSTRLVLSYYQPRDNGGKGHLRTGYIPWS
jgi:hypothetical protein